MTTFRWSLWNPDPVSVFMLSHSIATFRRFFGGTARYVVFTDMVDTLKLNILAQAEIRDYRSGKDTAYIDQRITWRKWAPTPRLDPTTTEVYVDSDIFLVAEPSELRAFCQDESNCSLLVAQEEFAALWPYGNFGQKLVEEFLPINAGLIGQRPGADISRVLREEYEWWRKNVREEDIKYHDEQGAVACALQSCAKDIGIMALPVNRYRVVCPLNQPAIEKIEGVCMIHATYPEHPAFWKFLPDICQISGLPMSIAPWRLQRAV